MALVQVNPTEEKPKTSALENAAKVLGVLNNLGNMAAGGYEAFVNRPQELAKMSNITEAQKHKFFLEGTKKPEELGLF